MNEQQIQIGTHVSSPFQNTWVVIAKVGNAIAIKEVIKNDRLDTLNQVIWFDVSEIVEYIKRGVFVITKS